MKLRASVH